MIEIQNLSKSYGKLQVLHNVSVSFTQGHVTSIIGPNGSGKTTMIKCLLGMVLPDSGSIKVDGNDVLQQWEYRSKIGYMPQISRFPENMLIRQVIAMMKDIRHTGQPLDEELIAEYKLEQMYEKTLGSLSGGTKQKVSAVLAFLFNPQILVLDEPTAGLDPIAAEILKSKIQREKQKGKLIMVTSHIMSEVEEVADQILCLVDGHLRFFTSVENLKIQTGEDRLGKAVAKALETNLATVQE